MQNPEILDNSIAKLIQDGIDRDISDAEFNQLALEIFEYQFLNNKIYHDYCRRKNRFPENISHWKQIPAVHTEAFKESELICFPIENTKIIFQTSGTSRNKFGQHYFDTIRLYELSIRVNFKTHLLPDMDKMPMMILTPAYKQMPNSSLVYMLDHILYHFGTENSRYFIKNKQLLINELIENLRYYETSDIPVFLLGTAFSFIHFLDDCITRKIKFQLPHGSRIMETGGFKGKSRELSKIELYKLFESILGIPEEFCINEYGMTELGTQYYDNKLRKHMEKKYGLSFKVIPPWSKIMIMHPDTMEELPDNEYGLIRHIDLTNRGSVMAIQTDDIGYKTAQGFEIIKRSNTTGVRGCSVTIDEILSTFLQK